jgi:hypothetical protein
MTTRVFDIYGQEQTLAWLASRYDGCMILPARLNGEPEAWRLQAVFCTTGPAVLKIEARNSRGAAADNQPVVMTYAELGNPNPELDDLTAYPNRWSDRGKVHRANSDGVFGFGLGPTYGPVYHAWVLSSAPSDCLTMTGMKGGTEHEGPLHGVWQLEAVEPDHATLHDALLWNGEKNQVIQFNPDAALQKRIFAANFVPNSPEFNLTFGDVAYVAQRAEHLGSGEVRVYYVRRGHWNDVSYVTR